MILKKNATVLIYSLVLVTLSLLMAMVVLNNTVLLQNEYNYYSNQNKISDSVMGKGNLAIKFARYVNSNGSGYVDNISCPTNITMSGTVNMQAGIDTVLSYTGGLIKCMGVYLGDPFEVLFSSGRTNIEFARYKGSLVSVDSGDPRVGYFGDTDGTRITFSESSIFVGDGFDDDMNSDNYSGTSTGTLTYPNNYQDDDINARTTMYGFVSPGLGETNVFWNNYKTNRFIDNVTSNTGGLNINIGDTTNAHLYLDVDKDHHLRLYRFSRESYEEFNEMVLQDTLTGSISSGSLGYVQNNLSLSPIKTGNEYSFNFKDNDYALFIENHSPDILFYKITGENVTGTGIFLGMVDDTQPNTIKVLSNHVEKDLYGNFMTSQFEIIGEK